MRGSVWIVFGCVAILASACQREGEFQAVRDEPGPKQADTESSGPGPGGALGAATSEVREDDHRIKEGPGTVTVQGGDYSATLTVRSWDNSRDRDDYRGLFGAIDRTVLQDLRVTYKGKPAPLYRSSYADMANVVSCWIETTFGDAIIWIEGGDAGDSYKCRIVLKKGELVSRTLADGEFPEYFSETTSYMNVGPDN